MIRISNGGKAIGEELLESEEKSKSKREDCENLSQGSE